MAQDHDTSVLESLLQVTVDSARGYHDAAEHVTDASLQSMFRTRAANRRAIAAQLGEAIAAAGGKPGAAGSTAAPRLELDFDRLAGDDDRAVISEVERGEDHIKERYEQALQNQSIPPDQRSLITRFYETIGADHDDISAMKHGAEAAE